MPTTSPSVSCRCTRTSGARAPSSCAGDEREMHGAIDVILVAVHAELAELRLDRLLGDALDRALLLEPIADQIRDRADLELVLLRERLEIRPARHACRRR